MKSKAEALLRAMEEEEGVLTLAHRLLIELVCNWCMWELFVNRLLSVAALNFCRGKFQGHSTDGCHYVLIKLRRATGHRLTLTQTNTDI